MMKAVIIDDEPDARDILKSFINLYTPEIDFIGEAESVDSGIRLLREKDPDLVFLDIQMTDGSGFDLLDQYTGRFDVIFTTAHDHYALKAIKYSAMDYLLKPIDPYEFKKALIKIRDRKPEDPHQKEALKLFRNSLKNPAEARLVLHDQKGINYVNPAEIVVLNSHKNLTIVSLKGKEQLVITKTLKEFEDMLCEDGFYRIHNTCIVNLNHIVRYVKEDGGYVIMNDNQRYEVSRRKKNDFLETLKLWSES